MEIGRKIGFLNNLFTKINRINLYFVIILSMFLVSAAHTGVYLVYRSCWSLKPHYMFLNNNVVLCMLHICRFLVWNLLSEIFDHNPIKAPLPGGFPSGLSIIILLKDPGLNFNLRTLSSNPLWSSAQFIVVLMTANCPVPEAPKQSHNHNISTPVLHNWYEGPSP